LSSPFALSLSKGQAGTRPGAALRKVKARMVEQV
jgi:hypothetical protein